MTPTPRLIGILGGLAVLSVAAVFTGIGGSGVLAIDLALILGVTVEWFRTPRVESLEVERDLPIRIGLGRTSERRLRLRLPEGTPRRHRSEYRVWVHEATPLEVEAVPSEGATAHGGNREASDEVPPEGGELDSGTTLELVRTYRFRRRGRHAFGPLRIRLQSPWGWIERTSRWNGQASVDVEPALPGLARALELSASDRWQDLGVRRLPRRGGRTEFESLRRWVAGDDRRQVDWKATARRGFVTVRESREERGQELWIAVDLGRPMAEAGAVSPSPDYAGWTRLDHALDAALTLASIALQQGDRVGIVAFDRRTRVSVAARRGKAHFATLKGRVFDLQPSPGPSDVGRALRELGTRHRRRAVVVVLSEVEDPLSAESQRRGLEHAAGHHRVVFAGFEDRGLLEASRGGHGDPRRRLAAAMEHGDRERAFGTLGKGRVRVLAPLPADACGQLLGAWLSARRG